jgi:small redox-active disulfide protein 2
MSTEIKVLGPGCMKCKTLDKLTREVVEEHGFDVSVSKVEDIVEIMQYNIIATPALVINNKVVLKGGVPSKEKLADIIKQSIDG